MTRKPLPKPAKGAKPAAPVKAPSKPARAPRAPPPPKPLEPTEAPEAPPLTASDGVPFHANGEGETYHIPEQDVVFASHYGPDDESFDESPATNGAHVEIEPLRVEPSVVHLPPESTVLYLADPGDAYTDLALAMVANPRVRFVVRGSVPASEAIALGQTFADKIGLQIDIVGEDMEIRQTLLPQPLQPTTNPPRRRIKAADIDWAVRPEIGPGVNVGINGLLDRIEAARGDLAKLQSFVGTFRGSRGTEEDYRIASTYYRIAGRYLHGLIAEARGVAVGQLRDGEDLRAS
jgi:hypothetical protein